MKIRFMCGLLALLMLLPAGVWAAQPVSFEMRSAAGILVDYATGTVLMEHNAHQQRPVASVTKVMTLLLVMEALQQGLYGLDDTLQPSARAQSMGGSQAYIESSCTYSVGELIKSVIVASANDSCVALAEYTCGSVEAFVQRMNTRAAELGMADSHFINCTGLPAEGQLTTAHDVAIMMRALLGHGEYYQYSGVWMYEMNHGERVTLLSNTNKLLRSYEGCDGGKTGFTNEAGHCMAATAKRGDSRFIAVVLGAPSSAVRFEEAAALLSCGFAEYETRILHEERSLIRENIPVRNGNRESVNGVAGERVSFTVHRAQGDSVETRVELPEVLSAPIAAGEQIGWLYTYVGGSLAAKTPLLADSAVEKAGFGDVLLRIVKGFFSHSSADPAQG